MPEQMHQLYTLAWPIAVALGIIISCWGFRLQNSELLKATTTILGLNLAVATFSAHWDFASYGEPYLFLVAVYAAAGVIIHIRPASLWSAVLIALFIFSVATQGTVGIHEYFYGYSKSTYKIGWWCLQGSGFMTLATLLVWSGVDGGRRYINNSLGSIARPPNPSSG